MNRRYFFLGLAGLGASCGRPETPTLNVLNWFDYVAPDTIPNFEAEFGVHVNYGTFESNEEMLAKVESGNSGWDVVFPSHYFIRPMRDLNLLATLDHALVPNLANLGGQFREPVWDPSVLHSVPFMWGTTGIAYNQDFGAPPERWADLWDERMRGKLTMLDDPAEVFGACLKKIGLSLNATAPDELAAARDEAVRQKPLVRAYLNSEVQDQLVAGDVQVAQLWATTALAAMESSDDLVFVHPAEGFAVYADTVAVLRECRQPELAHRFVDYLLRPDVAAAIVVETKTATANAAAQKTLPPGVRDDPVIYPPDDVLARGEWFESLPPETQQLRDRLWTEIKAA